MRTRFAALAFVGLATVAVSLGGAAPVQADPNVPCGSRSTYIDAGTDYYNLTFKNCTGSHISVQAYDEWAGYVGDCKPVANGQWVSWTGLRAPAWQGWEARPC